MFVALTTDENSRRPIKMSNWNYSILLTRWRPLDIKVVAFKIPTKEISIPKPVWPHFKSEEGLLSNVGHWVLSQKCSCHCRSNRSWNGPNAFEPSSLLRYKNQVLALELLSRDTKKYEPKFSKIIYWAWYSIYSHVFPVTKWYESFTGLYLQVCKYRPIFKIIRSPRRVEFHIIMLISTFKFEEL